MLKILLSISEFGGLWKHPNTPACTSSVKVFNLLRLDTIQKKKMTMMKKEMMTKKITNTKKMKQKQKKKMMKIKKKFK